MADKIKTLAELTQGGLSQNDIRRLEKTLKITRRAGDSLKNVFEVDPKQIKKVLNSLDKYANKLEDQKKLVVELEMARKVYARKDTELSLDLSRAYDKILKQIEDQAQATKELTEEQKRLEQQVGRVERAFSAGYDLVETAINRVVQQSSDLFKISHDLQIQGNLTWNQYTKLYNDSFKAIRDMNQALGQSVFNTRELFEAQQKLIPEGWRGIDPTQLTNLSQAVLQINSTLGMFPQELSTAFQMSFRQFEEQTDNFVYAIGNRLNAFSNSFGVTVGALTGAVTQMMAANTFLARNNMSAQILANESLMRAVALSSAVGIETTNFMVGLAQTAQFGTASQMADLYETGALLQGFSMADFQSQMRGLDYAGATEDLIGSIRTTLGGMDEGYLRNEYMQRIAQGFGLSQNDILQILSNDFDLSEKSLEIQQKLVDVDTSMEQELSGLRIDLMDRLNNWWDSTSTSQGIGKILQDHGLTGISRQLNYILFAIMGQDLQRALVSKVGGAARGIISGAGGLGGGAGLGLGLGSLAPGVAGATPLLTSAPMGSLLGGAAIAGLGNIAGRQFISSGTTSADYYGGGALNILSGIVGGAAMGGMTGSIPGAVIGGVIGGVGGALNTADAVKKRRTALDDIEAERRQKARDTSTPTTQDPVLAELQLLNRNVRGVLATVEGGFHTQRTIEVTKLMSDKADTKK